MAAGNPPEYNKSVREFDVVTLDRIRRIQVEEDFGVWKEYAYQAGIHPAVISYLDIHRDHFYRMETSVDGRMFVTARGWEDLSQLLYAYEQLGKTADREVVGQYIQHWNTAKDFANYLELFEKYKTDYQIDAVLEGQFEKFATDKLKLASFDEKFSVVGLLLGRLGRAFYQYYEQDLYVNDLFEKLKRFKKDLDLGTVPSLAMKNRIQMEQENLEKKQLAKQLTLPVEKEKRKMIHFLQSLVPAIEKGEQEGMESAELFSCASMPFQKEVQAREEDIGKTKEKLENAFHFLKMAFGEGQEMVIFMTELNTNPYSVQFISENGCDSYYKYNKKLLFEEEQMSILSELDSIEQDL